MGEMTVKSPEFWETFLLQQAVSIKPITHRPEKTAMAAPMPKPAALSVKAS